jgi:hypothetical protein
MTIRHRGAWSGPDQAQSRRACGRRQALAAGWGSSTPCAICRLLTSTARPWQVQADRPAGRRYRRSTICSLLRDFQPGARNTIRTLPPWRITTWSKDPFVRHGCELAVMAFMPSWTLMIVTEILQWPSLHDSANELTG